LIPGDWCRKAEMKRYLRYLKIRLRRSIRDPKFLLEILVFVVLAVYTVFTAFMYWANRDAAKSAKSAADTAAKQFETGERPWVDTDIAIDGPVTWDVNGMNVTVKINATNSGHSPALSVFSSALLLIGTKGTINASNYRSQVCGDAGTAASHANVGVALFPGRTIERQYGLSVSNEGVEQGKAQKEFPGSKFGNVILGPTLVVCTAYRPTFNTTSIYHTAYLMDLFKLDSKGNIVAMFTIGEDVAADRLRLRFSALGAISAE